MSSFGLIFAVGCEAPDPETLDALAGRLEQRAQRQFGGRQKVGMLRALEVSQRAARVARAMRDMPQAACEMSVLEGRAFRYEFDLLLERRGPGKAGLTARWHEKRTLRRSESGALELVMKAEFSNPIMQPTDVPGRRVLRWVVAQDLSYLSDDLRDDLKDGLKEDAPEFYRRSASFGEREELQFAGLGTLQTLLDATPQGWQRVPGPSPKWKLGEQKLRCMMPIRGLQNAQNMQMQSQVAEVNWGHQFGEVSTLLDADFEVLRATGPPSESDDAVTETSTETPADSRELTLEWRLRDGATLKAVFRDTWSESAELIELPESKNIIEVERDRSLFEAKQRLQKWREDAWIIPASEVEKP